MDEMKVFENSEFGCLEVLWEGEKAYFPAIKCAEILGYSNPRDAVVRHCKVEGVVKHDVVSISQNQYGVETEQIVTKKFISEGNLYRLIVRSKLEAAQRFERWVFDEVLPDIRRQGFHITTEALERLLSDPETAIRTFTALKEEREKNRALTEENRILTQKCGYLDLITACTDAVPITVIAKDYGMSGREMNRLLHNLDVQFQLQCGTWVLYQKYANHGYTRSRTIVYDDVHCRSAVHTYWTQRGRRFLYEFLKERGHLPLCEKGGDADEDSGM